VQVPLEQAELSQSLLVAQPLPAAQWVEQLPPQSGAVSLPFLTPSLQVAAAHEPFLHLPLAGKTQSLSFWQL
jgi:hypothetical protein